MVRLTLEWGHNLAVLLGVLALAVGLTVAFYRRSAGEVAPGRWRTLVALRGSAIALVVLLLFRPVLSVEREEDRERHLVFLLDRSASMGTVDDTSGQTRFDQARSRILDWAGRLEKDFTLHLLAFTDRATSLERPAALSELKADGQATSMIRGMRAAVAAVPRRDDLEAVVLLSDGIHNAAGDPVAAAKSLGVVVHAVGVGNSLRDSPSYRDVRITDMVCPDQLPVDNRAEIKAQVGNVGLAGRVVPVVLEQDGAEVGRVELELTPGEMPQEVTFEFVPTEKGRHTYTARIPEQPGETIARNNSRSAVALVVESRIKVLYLEGTLRAEYGALVQRFMSRDPDLEFYALVQTRPGQFVERTNMEGVTLSTLPADAAALEPFDVVIIGDLDASAWKPEQLDLVVERVRAGGGLLMIGGYHGLGPGGYGGTALGAILPVDPGPRDIGQVTEPFLPILTPDGQAHPIFANIAGFFPTRNAPPREPGLPPLDGCVRVGAARPGATVLAELADPGGGSPMPVLAVQPLGAGRTAVFAGDTTRNWQQAPRAMEQDSPFLRFWGQTVRWLANRSEEVEAGAGLTARTDKAYYEPDAPIAVQAVVRGDRGEGTSQAAVTARIDENDTRDEAGSIHLAPSADSPGRYDGTLEPLPAGTHTIVVEARLGEETLTTEPLTVEIGRPNLEFDRLDLDDATLSKVAGATGGRYQHVSTADRLIAELNREVERRRVTLERPLARPRPYWALFVGLLAVEWTLRKRYGLR